MLKPYHVAIFNAWHLCVKQVSFHGLRGVMHQPVDPENGLPAFPPIEASLPVIDGVHRSDVIHTPSKRAKSSVWKPYNGLVGFPLLAFGANAMIRRALHRSMVHIFIDGVWEISPPEQRPAFIVYDNACNLLRHIVRRACNNPSP